ncbi:6-phosphogluconolactonase [Pseudodesulfovibrio tunisiensis]|uniref:6-phosphogluconolactonase n=1 Tax=Pseudodesulfovibrio tunisiensis TaxID=463192 RepID=UPI001FB28EE2|nr:6-phosphogluconolactonase [Pseudodesulfovibrio tunisiensis]
MPEIRVFPDTRALSRGAAELFVFHSHRALERSGRFAVALSGGSSPLPVFEMLASEPLWRAVPWDRTHVFWGDDRAVGPDHEHSNYRPARDLLLSRVPIPGDHVHRIRGELGAQDAAVAYRQELARFFEDAVPAFDLMLQGLGPDGHTASLFPGSHALDSREWVEPVPAPDMEPRVERVTMTLPLLAAAKNVIVLATGVSKAPVLKNIFSAASESEKYPVARLFSGDVLWLTDQPTHALATEG